MEMMDFHSEQSIVNHHELFKVMETQIMNSRLILILE
jgi:hypothetical protein